MDHRFYKFSKHPESQSIKNRDSKRNGFSLIEVLIALVLLVVGLLALGGMQIVSIKGNSFSQQMTQATVLTQSKLEEIKKWSFMDSGLSSGHHDEGVLSSSGFSRSYDVEDISATLKAVTVTVRWREETDRSISLFTMEAK